MCIPGNAQEPPGGAEDGASPTSRGTFASCLPMPGDGSYDEKREEAATRVREEQERMRLEIEELRKWKAENTPKPKDEPKKKKSIISLIDDSDGEGENLDVSENKIAKAIQAK